MKVLFYSTVALTAMALTGPASAANDAASIEVNANVKLVTTGQSVSVARIPDGVYLRTVNDPNDIIWDRIPEYRVHMTPAPALHPSVALRVNYEESRDVYVMLARTSERFYVRMRWHDNTMDEQTLRDQFTDGAAVQFSLHDEATSYMMGTDADAPVNIWYWSPDQASVQNLAAGGHGSTTMLNEQPVSGAAEYVPPTAQGAGQWVVVMSRPLDTAGDYQVSFDQATVPMSFALWDGSKAQRDGNKNVSHGWILAEMGE